MSIALQLEQVNAGYGKLWILYNINLKIEEGKITAIIGPNGSGKSTLLKTIFGLTSLYSGNILLWNRDITGLAPHERAKEGIAYLPQLNNAFYNLSVYENLVMASYTLAKDEAERSIDEVLSRFSLLRTFLRRKAGSLSGGERQLLAMAMAMMRKPRIMLFDEPTAALAPRIAGKLLSDIRKLRDELGITIVLVEQNARKALEISDKAVLMVGGRVAYYGNSKELLENPELGRMYLGLKD